MTLPPFHVSPWKVKLRRCQIKNPAPQTPSGRRNHGHNPQGKVVTIRYYNPFSNIHMKLGKKKCTKETTIRNNYILLLGGDSMGEVAGVSFGVGGNSVFLIEGGDRGWARVLVEGSLTNSFPPGDSGA